MREPSAHPLTPYVVALASIAAATVLRLLLDPILGVRFPFATVFFAVLLTAWYGGFWPALLASVSGAFASAWFLFAPRGTLAIDDAENLGGLTLYLAVSFGIALIGGGMQAARRRAEANAAAAAAQREQLRVTLESIGDAVLVTDTQGRVTSLNAVAAELTGWLAADAVGQPLHEVFRIVNEHSGETVRNPVETVLAEGRIVGLANHTMLVARDGSRRPIDDTAAPIRDASGTLTGVVLVFRDVTEKRLAEERLRRSERELGDFFENANVGLHFVGPDGVILRANQAELALLGYQRDEYVGRHIADFHADRAVIDDILRRLAAGETIRDQPARMRCKDGSLKDVLISSSVHWENGRFLHTRCITIDVTTRRAAEQAQALLAAVVESSDDAIISKTLDGVITSWNQGAERLFGYTPAEAIGQPILMLIPAGRREEEPALLERLRRGERIEHFETVRIAKDGRLLDISLTVSPVRDATGRIIGASKVARDVTERKRTEEALRAADRRKDAFLATLAHELRNPLAPVRHSLEIMKRADGDASLAQRGLATMARQVAHLERLVEDLVDVARISRDRLDLRRERVDLATVIAQAVDTCRPLAEAGRLELHVAAPKDGIVLDADAVRLIQVFSNLLSNACKFTGAGGQVWIETRRDGSDAVVVVRDTGYGIPPEMLGSIFEMFTQLEPAPDRTQSGLGIGLTLVKRLVEMHGGTVEARSEGAGRGSEFVVRLPLAASRLPDHPDPPPPLPAGARRRILVVDDNANAAESLAMLLQISGHDTHLAHDGAAALGAAETLRPDVVLLDIGLPKMSGHEVARRIRSQAWGREIMLVALTGWGQDEDRRKSRETGFDHHLVKPVDVAALMHLLATPDASPIVDSGNAD